MTSATFASPPPPPPPRESAPRSSRRPAEPPLSKEELADYLVEMGGLLVSYGCPSYRAEDVIRRVGEIEGLEAQAFAIPTGLFVTVKGGDGKEPAIRMTRVRDWGTDLDRLVLIDAIFNDVADDRLSIRDARAKLLGVQKRAPLYPNTAVIGATGVLSGAAAIFFRGGVAEMAMSAGIGAVVGTIAWAAGKRDGARFLVEFLGALVAALLVWGCTILRPDLSREVLIPSAVISLFPGMTLTTGLAELARKNLVAGAARLMEAFVAFLLILFGIAAAISAENLVGDKLAPAAAREALPWPVQVWAMIAASLAFGVFFVMPKRFAWAAIVSASIGWVATAFGTRHLPPHVAAFGASLSVCLFANAAARVTQRPAQLFQLPGMMLLVPGSVGFLSLEDFLRGDFASGQTKGFTMLLIAGGIVTGVLFANVMLPAKKLL